MCICPISRYDDVQLNLLDALQDANEFALSTQRKIYISNFLLFSKVGPLRVVAPHRQTLTQARALLYKGLPKY
jgi:hypothetical protein